MHLSVTPRYVFLVLFLVACRALGHFEISSNLSYMLNFTAKTTPKMWKALVYRLAKQRAELEWVNPYMVQHLTSGTKCNCTIQIPMRSLDLDEIVKATKNKLCLSEMNPKITCGYGIMRVASVVGLAACGYKIVGSPSGHGKIMCNKTNTKYSTCNTKSFPY